MPATPAAVAALHKVSIALHRLAIRNLGQRQAEGCFTCSKQEADEIARLIDLHFPQSEAPEDKSGLGQKDEAQGFQDTMASIQAAITPPKPSPMPMQAGSPLLPRIKELLAGSKKGFRVSNLATALKAPEADIELAISQPGSGLEIGQAGWVKAVK